MGIGKDCARYTQGTIMARNKKARRSSPKKIPSFYKKGIYGLGFMSIILMGYCYFTAHSDHIPTISGPNYPKRTPGMAPQTRTYAVYDRLAQEASPNKTMRMARLLPPDETPEWENPEEITPHHTIPAAPTVASSSANPVDSLAASSARGVPGTPASGHSSQTVAGLLSSLSASPQSTSTKTPSKGAKDIKKSSKPLSKLLSKPDVRHNKASKQAIKTKPPLKKVVRMQMGGTCDSEEKAQKLVQRLIQQGGMPSGKRLVIQKAIIRGKALYRVILIGS